MRNLFVGDDLKNCYEPKSFVLGCEDKLDSSSEALNMRDTGFEFQQASADPKADSTDGSQRQWLVELDQKAFDANVSGVPEQYGLADQKLHW